MNAPAVPMTTRRRRRRRTIFTTAVAAAVATAIYVCDEEATFATSYSIRQLLQENAGSSEAEQQFDPNAPPPMLSSADANGTPRLRHLYQGGRWGNILFQWASTYAIAKANDMMPCLVENRDRSLPLHMYFEDSSQFPICEGVHDADAREEPMWDGGFRAAWRFFKVGDSSTTSTTYYERNGHTGEDINLKGFMESASNLDGVEDDIVAMFTFREKYRQEAEEYIAPIREGGYIPVGIHARRGDKSKLCCQPQYFQDAMTNITNTLRERGDDKEIMWLVASQLPDGPDWYAEMKSLGVFPEENTRYIGKSTVADFNILTQSDHIIVTHGTYSFFTGYLGAWQKRREGGIVIQPSTMKEISGGLDWTTIDGCLPPSEK